MHAGVLNDVKNSVDEAKDQAAARLPRRTFKVSVDDRLQHFVSHVQVALNFSVVAHLEDQAHGRFDFTGQPERPYNKRRINGARKWRSFEAGRAGVV